jgi:hypothetical protein
LIRLQLHLFFLLFLWAGFSYAGPKEDAANKRKEAEKLFTQGDYNAALTTYDEAHAIFADPSDWLGRAQVLIKLHRYIEANDAYQQFLATGKAGKKQKEIKHAIEDLSIILQTKITCNSRPEGVTVYLNSRVDEPLGITPLETNIVPGTHRLIFEKEGFEPFIQLITVEPKSSQTVNAELKVPQAVLSIQSIPISAQIKINGEEKGNTPLEIKLPAGAYEIEASASGYATQRKKIEAKDQQKLSWSIDLTQPPPGFLLLQVSPPEAVITIDGKEFKQGNKIELKPSVYPILIVAEGYKEQRQELTIESDKESTLKTTLEANGAWLQVKANRPSFTLSLNDAPVVLDANGKILLPGGEQMLSIQAPGAASWSEKVKIEKRGLVAEVTFKNAPQTSTKASIGAGASLLATSVLFGYAGLVRAKIIREACLDPDFCNQNNQELVTLDRERGLFFRVSVGTGMIGAAVLSYGIYKKRQEGKTSVKLIEQDAAP